MTPSSSTVILLGRNYSVPGQIFTDTLPASNVSFGITSGKTQKPNQDALTVTESSKAILLAVADGHWGNEASELAIQKTLAFFSSSVRPPYGNEVRARLYVLFDQINNVIYEQALNSSIGITPETTLIVCYIQLDTHPIYLYWASFGDSYLFLKSSHQIKQLNTLFPRWLGTLSKMAERTASGVIELPYPNGTTDSYTNVPQGLETGVEILASDDTLILCTDGLMESGGNAATLTCDDIAESLTQFQSTKEQVKALIDLAMQRGGLDNVACIIAEIPDPTRDKPAAS